MTKVLAYFRERAGGVPEFEWLEAPAEVTAWSRVKGRPAMARLG